MSAPTTAPPPRTTSHVHALDGSCGLGREAVGGKAWSIDRMRQLGLAVPPALVVAATAGPGVARSGGLDAALWSDLLGALAAVEAETGRTFGSAQRPLLLSVRSGAATSMPGMMDTVLDLGMDDAIEASLAAETGAAFAADTRARFEEQYRRVVLQGGDGEVPADPWEQLRRTVTAVFASWHSPRATAYRRHHGLSDDGGTAVTVQAMVFGNLDAQSGTGVLFSRNPLTGAPAPYGEWLAQGQGEDVVAGTRDPQPLDALREALPAVHAELLAATSLLEREGRAVQDVEFTVEAGRLWLLQTRTARCSPLASLRAAVDMAESGLITRSEAVARVSEEQLRQLSTATAVRGDASLPVLASGVSACPGTAVGIVVCDPDEAEARADAGEDVVLARATTSPDDVHGIIAARAVVTELGGATSHAAVVSRELGRPCVVGCGVGTVTALEGRLVLVDGAAGTVLPASESTVLGTVRADRELELLRSWAAASADPSR